ncbi:MAG: porin [Pseudomonadales bacterium]|nr:porin [Pseudomonadales bacterium]
MLNNLISRNLPTLGFVLLSSAAYSNAETKNSIQTIPPSSIDNISESLSDKKDDAINTDDLSSNTRNSTNAFSDDPLNNLNVYYDDLTHFATTDGNTHLKVEMRLQTRFSTPFDGNPSSIDKLEEDAVSNMQLKRARFKVGGHFYKPWIQLKYEYDLVGSQTLDARITLKAADEFQFRFGRYKAHYSPERVASSKDQQMVDRSMVNSYFTLDRQQGVSILGRLNKGTAFDVSYWVDVFNGTGREGSNESEDFMYVARLQSNFLGEQIETAMGDLKFRDKPAAHIGIAASTNKSRYTKFSTSAPGQLEGFDEHMEADGYHLQQWMVDAAFKYNGFSLQGEYHVKDVTDQYNENFTGTKSMNGYYLQGGFFPSVFSNKISDKLEFTTRYAQVNPDSSMTGTDQEREYLIGANWFFNGHRNKLTADIGRYAIDDALTGMTTSENRIRLQYDVSF